MPSKSLVTVKNKTNHGFKATLVFLSEVKMSSEKFWKANKLKKNKCEAGCNYLVEAGRSTIFGELVHPVNLVGRVNFFVSIIINEIKGGRVEADAFTSTSSTNQASHLSRLRDENILILKCRIKGSAALTKTYVTASSYPERTAITKSFWCKDVEKVKCEC